MVQYKKDEIKERIDSAALYMFAEKGYCGTKISDIAESADVSVGNIYRYYQGKDEIFYSVTPESFWHSLQSLLFRKVGVLRVNTGDSSEQSIEPSLVNNQFIEFIVANRERMLILLAGSQGTKYENIKAQLVSFLVSTVKKIYQVQYEQFIAEYKSDFIIIKIYEKLVDTYASILKEAKTLEELQDFIKVINTYHLFGITSLLKIESSLFTR